MSDMLVVPRVPSAWRQAPDITQDCGAYQMQTVLAAYGRGVCISLLRPPAWARGYTFPWTVPALLKQHGGLETKTWYGFRARECAVIARRALARGHPLMVLIRATRGKGGIHWISVWGHDAARNIFLAYDSQYATRTGGIGNAEYAPEFLASRFHSWMRVAIEVMP